ncbi:MAG: hypothetical protein AAF384_06175 [Pseudomonadota bacterium]
MASTAIDAVHEHLAAINSKRRDRFAETITYPFFHIEPNGEKVIYASKKAVPDMSAMPFARAQIVKDELVATSGQLQVYFLHFQRYDENDDPTILAQALWGVGEARGEWKIGWRQYLGEIGATTHPSLLAPLASEPQT